MKNKTPVLLFILLCALLAPFILSSSVKAYKYNPKNSTTVINKIMTKNTYTATRIFTKSITPLWLIDHIINVEKDLSLPRVPFRQTVNENCEIPIPNIFVDGDYSSKSPTLKCQDFLIGDADGWEGIETLPTADGIRYSTTNEDQWVKPAVEYLEKFGYSQGEPEELAETKKCLYFNMTDYRNPNNPDTYTTNEICALIDPDTKYIYDFELKQKNDLSNGRFSIDAEYNSDGWTITLKPSEIWLLHHYSGDGFENEDGDEDDGDITWGEFVNNSETAIINSLNGKRDEKDKTCMRVGPVDSDYNIDNGYEYYEYRICTVDSSKSEDYNLTGDPGPKTWYTINIGDAKTQDQIVKNILGFSGTNGKAEYLSQAEVYNMYMKYLQREEYVTLNCSDNQYSSDWIHIRSIKIGDEIVHNCYFLETKPQKYTGAEAKIMDAKNYDPETGRYTTSPNAKYYFTGQNMTIQQIINEIDSWDLEAIKDQIDAVEAQEPSGEEDPDPTGSQNTCMSSGASGALGWIVCPILDWMGNAAATLYNEIIRPLLEVNSSYFEKQYTRDAWSVFRDAANIIFVILILVVIFSQLTGIGIDNYGIKKILPKLIVAAVLINLSYLICVICVDLSNIFGNGLQSFMDGIGQDMTKKILTAKIMEGSTVSNSTVSAAGLGSAIDTGFIAAGIITIVLSVYAIIKNPALLLTLLIVVLGVLISVLFLFILLVGREAAIVILTVISPIAFVLYMLPNTKKLFDKWLKLWEAMLFLYPICGLLIGGGNFASTLILFVGSGGSSNAFINTITALTAMVIGIIPLFFVPTLLKGAFAAMGTFGGMISGFGKRLSGGATKRMRDSGAYKNAQKMGQDRRMRFKAGYSERKGGLTRIGRAKAKVAGSWPGRLMGMNKRQAAYVETAKKNAGINEESRAVLASETAAADIAASGQKPKDFFQHQIDTANGNITKLNSVVLAAQKRGIKPKDIMAMIRESDKKGTLKFSSRESRVNWMNSMVQNHSDITATDFEGQEWFRNGGLDEKGNFEKLGEYGSYAKKHLTISDIDISDLSKVSGNSMAALINTGLVSTTMAQQWLAVNPNASSDKKIMMGAVAKGLIGEGSFASADELKKEAEMLANASGDENKMKQGTIYNSANRKGLEIKKLVGAWTAPAQQRSYISQDNSTMAEGQEQQRENPVYVQGVGQSTAGQPTSGAAAENQVFNVRELADETLLDMATNPKAADNDPTRMAAELEYRRREERRQGNPQPQPQNGPQNGPQPPNGPQGSP